MGVLAAVGLIAACVAVGVGLSYLCGVQMRAEERIAYGTVAGFMTVTLAGYLAGLAFGRLSGPIVTAAAVGAVAVSLVGWRTGAGRVGPELADLWRRLRGPLRSPANPVPLLLLVAAAWPLTVWILFHAYSDDGSGGLLAGHLASWTDWQAHLVYASSFAYAENFPADLPTAAGEDLPYHFGINLFAGMLARSGLSVQASLQVSSGMLAFAFPMVMWLAGVRLFASRAVASVAVLVFTLFGGLGFWRFFRDLIDGGWQAVWDLPTAGYTRLPDANVLMENPVTGHLFPQRPTLVGFAVLLIVCVLLWEGRRSGTTRPYVAAGLLVGVAPLFHLVSWATALGLGVIWALLDRRRQWWWFVVPALVVSLPVAWTLAPGNGDLDAEIWVRGENPVVFWWWNAGLFLPLLLAAQLWKGTVPRLLVWASIPVWLWLLAPNVLRLSPAHPVNNTHWLVMVFLLGSFLVAAVLVRLVTLPSVRPLGLAAAGLLFVSLTLSGAADIWKAADPATDIWPHPITSAEGVAAGTWARDATPPDSVFVTAPVHTHPVPALSGRSVVLGFAGWVNDLGVQDWPQRQRDVEVILSGSEGTEEALAAWGVDYVVIGPAERAIGADEAYWEQRATQVFSQGDWRVYEVVQRAGSGSGSGRV